MSGTRASVMVNIFGKCASTANERTCAKTDMKCTRTYVFLNVNLLSADVGQPCNWCSSY